MKAAREARRNRSVYTNQLSDRRTGEETFPISFSLNDLSGGDNELGRWSEESRPAEIRFFLAFSCQMLSIVGRMVWEGQGRDGGAMFIVYPGDVFCLERQ